MLILPVETLLRRFTKKKFSWRTIKANRNIRFFQLWHHKMETNAYECNWWLFQLIYFLFTQNIIQLTTIILISCKSYEISTSNQYSLATAGIYGC
jgi:hypothetical protein